MPPIGKPAATRQRRNRSSTASTLRREHDVETPQLPARPMPWNALTESWWADVWASPMAPEYDDSDLHGLFMLADLVDSYWTEESSRVRTALAAEIRLQRQCFGLTPIDRRRLQWEIERSEDAQARGRKRRPAPAPTPTDDPRSVLRAVP